jgi:hypothetical protein
MPYDATVYKVMIASPGDVGGARATVREVLAEWNIINADVRKMLLLPIGWDTHASPAVGDRPQAIINKQVLRDCDLLVGVFWTRMGTPTGGYPSGTVEEIEEHIKAGKPAMLYFSVEPVHPDSIDEEQYGELKRFREACRARGLCSTFSSLGEFKSEFYRHLQIELNKEQYARQGGRLGDQLIRSFVASKTPQLSKEAQLLLKEACRDPDGVVLRIITTDGFSVQTNRKDFVEESSPRARAKWESVIEELEAAGLIIDRGYKRELFGLTQEGYDVSDTTNP